MRQSLTTETIKCDRCGHDETADVEKEYGEYAATAKFTRGWISMQLGDEHDRKDLCPKCASEFQAWWHSVSLVKR